MPWDMQSRWSKTTQITRHRCGGSYRGALRWWGLAFFGPGGSRRDLPLVRGAQGMVPSRLPSGVSVVCWMD